MTAQIYALADFGRPFRAPQPVLVPADLAAPAPDLEVENHLDAILEHLSMARVATSHGDTMNALHHTDIALRLRVFIINKGYNDAQINAMIAALEGLAKEG